VTTEALFVRISPDLRSAIDEYLAEKGMSLGSGVADLLARGLEAAGAENAIGALEQSLADARASLRERDEQLGEASARVASAEAKVESLRTLAIQLEGAPAGRCPAPGCGTSFNAIDLVVRRQCSKGHALTSVLEQASHTPGLNSTETLIALGAIALLIGLVVASRSV